AEEHRSKASSTKPTAPSQAHSFYRTQLVPSILWGSHGRIYRHRPCGDGHSCPSKVVWGQPPPAVRPGAARLAFCRESPQLSTEEGPPRGQSPLHTTDPTPQTLSESKPPPPAQPPHTPSPVNPPADKPAPRAPRP